MCLKYKDIEFEEDYSYCRGRLSLLVGTQFRSLLDDLISLDICDPLQKIIFNAYFMNTRTSVVKIRFFITHYHLLRFENEV